MTTFWLDRTIPPLPGEPGYQVRLAVHDTPARDGAVPLLLLHGSGDNSHVWNQVTDPLVDAGLAPVALDQRGFGETRVTPATHGAPVPPQAFGFPAMVSDVIAVADRLGWDRFHLLGHSLGGYVARWVAHDHPDRLRSLVLLNAGTHGPLVRSGMDHHTRALAQEVAERGMEAISGSRMLRLVADGFSARYPDRAAAYASLRRRSDPDQYRMSLEAVACRREQAPLAPPPVPDLVITGDQDPVVPLKDATELARGLDARLEVLPECGHAPFVEQPARLALALASFYGSLGTG